MIKNLTKKSVVLASISQFDNWANDYDLPLTQWYFSQTSNQILNYLNQNDFNLIDIGCGTGELLRKIAKTYPKAKLFGCDISSKMIKKAKAKNSFKASSFFVCAADKIPVKNQAFDYAICSHSLHHHPNANNTIRETWRILAKNGVLILTDGVLDSFFHKCYFFLVNFFQNENYVTRYSTQELEEKLIATGFIVKKIKTISLFNKMFILQKT